MAARPDHVPIPQSSLLKKQTKEMRPEFAKLPQLPMVALVAACIAAQAVVATQAIMRAQPVVAAQAILIWLRTDALGLTSTVDAISCVTEPWQDVGVLVKGAIIRTGIERHIRIKREGFLHSLWTRHNG